MDGLTDGPTLTDLLYRGEIMPEPPPETPRRSGLARGLRTAQIARGPDGQPVIVVREPEVITRRQSDLDRPRVGAGEYGLPYMPRLRDEPAPELRSGPEPMPMQRVARMLGADRSPERKRLIGGLTGRTEDGRAVGLADLLPINPVLDYATHMARGKPGEAAMDVLPWAIVGAARPVAEGVKAVGRTIAAFPRTTAVSTGVAGAVLAPSEAGVASDTTMDPRLKEIEGLRAQITRAQNEIKTIGQTRYRGNEIEAGQSRDRASKPYIDTITRAEDRIAEIRRGMDSAETREVERAENARDAILRDAPKPFDKSMVGQYAAGVIPLLPYILGAYTGYKMGFPGARAERAALAEWQAALKRASETTSPRIKELETAVAKNFDDTWAKKTVLDKVGRYIAPAGVSAVEGAVVPNITPAYNSLRLDDENPERRSVQEYVRMLPEGRPERARAMRMLQDETVLPKGNPALKAARDYFLDWRTQMVPRSVAGALEGVAGSLPATTAALAYSPWEKALPRARTHALVREWNARQRALGPGASAPMSRQLQSEGELLPAQPKLPPSGPAPRQLPAPTAEAPPPAPASSAPAVSKTSRQQSSRSPDMPEWASPPPEGVTLPAGQFWDARLGQPRAAGKFASKPGSKAESKPSNMAVQGEEPVKTPIQIDDLVPYGRSGGRGDRSSDAGGLGAYLRNLA